MRELQAGGLRVPEDIAVVGFDDIYPGSLIAPLLTTVRQPMRQLGERACSRLLERIADPGLPHRAELLPTELIVRESCGCPPQPREYRPRLPGLPALATASARLTGNMPPSSAGH